MANLDQLLEDEKLIRFEGERGVRNLAILANRLGYKDHQYFGQFQGGCYGDLIHFLEDNSGAIEAIIDWVRDNQDVFQLTDDEEDDDEEEDEDEDDDDEINDLVKLAEEKNVTVADIASAFQAEEEYETLHEIIVAAIEHGHSTKDIQTVIERGYFRCD